MEGHHGVLEQQGQHLVCFAGGTFALGGKLFDKSEHIDIGTKLTDGCIWAYNAMPLGIMPEVFFMSACPSIEKCAWNETVWKSDVMTQKESDEPIAAADRYTEEESLPPGFVSFRDKKYIIRPEAIESIFVLYRITGRKDLLETAWTIFQAIQLNTKTELANGALSDVTTKNGRLSVMDSMESSWLAETLKYFYLIFSDPSFISLDDYVFNTEAHPLLRPRA